MRSQHTLVSYFWMHLLSLEESEHIYNYMYVSAEFGCHELDDNTFFDERTVSVNIV